MNWTAYHTHVDPKLITHRIIFNPNYGGRGTKVPGTCAVKIRQKGIKPETRAAIRESIKREGFRNLIILYKSGGEYFLSFGGGRLQAAKELDEPIPAIVVDYDDICDSLHGDNAIGVDEDNWQEFFRDVPTLFEWNDTGIQMHYGLERGRGEWYDPAGIAWIQTDEERAAVLKESPWLDDGRS